MGEEKTEKQAREEAQKLARKIGDEEWEKGETKYALEAYEASDITAAELLEKAQKLLEAERIAKKWEDAENTAWELPAGHTANVACDKCIRCRTLKDIDQKYKNQLIGLLGWKEDASYVRSDDAPYYRAAAIACFKVIKRVFPEEKE